MYIINFLVLNHSLLLFQNLSAIIPISIKTCCYYSDSRVYRRIPVRIMGAYHEPPDPILVPEQTEKLVAEFVGNKKMHPIERAALFHLKFEGVHPFVDGNGRTGRLIMNLMLMQAGYPPINVKYSDRKRYYEAFDGYYRDNSSANMISIITEELTHRLKMYCFITKE